MHAVVLLRYVQNGYQFIYVQNITIAIRTVVYSPSTTPYDKNYTAISIVSTVKQFSLYMQRNSNSISNYILIIQYSLLPVYCLNEAFIASIPHTSL